MKVPTQNLASFVKILTSSVTVFASLIALTVHAETFEQIRAIEGVEEVEYLSPYLIVQLSEGALFKGAVFEIREIANKGTDPDLQALGGKYKLRYYSEKKYKAHKKEHKDIHEADTVSKMQQLFRNSNFASVYELDWKTDAVLGPPKYFSQSGDWNSTKSYESDKHVVESFVAKLRTTKIRPERLLCINTVSHGPLAYLVIDGKIKVNRVSIPWNKFYPAMKKKAFTPEAKSDSQMTNPSSRLLD